MIIAMSSITTSRIQIQEKAEERRWQKWEEKTTFREGKELKYWGKCKDKDYDKPKDKDKDKSKDKDKEGEELKYWGQCKDKVWRMTFKTGSLLFGKKRFFVYLWNFNLPWTGANVNKPITQAKNQRESRWGGDPSYLSSSPYIGIHHMSSSNTPSLRIHHTSSSNASSSRRYHMSSSPYIIIKDIYAYMHICHHHVGDILSYLIYYCSIQNPNYNWNTAQLNWFANFCFECLLYHILKMIYNLSDKQFSPGGQWICLE